VKILVQTDEERKAKKKEYNQKYALQPEVKAKKKDTQKSAKGKAYLKSYRARPKIAKKLEEWRKSYAGEKKLYDEMDYVKKQKRGTNESRRLLIFQHYSKFHSNSDIPCCRCCGENSHLDFLALDHILGRKEMDSIPELVAIGYSSELYHQKLQRWIIENNFPDYFQILCQNCNFAKGMKKNNHKCPMENKPH